MNQFKLIITSLKSTCELKNILLIHESTSPRQSTSSLLHIDLILDIMFFSPLVCFPLGFPFQDLMSWLPSLRPLCFLHGQFFEISKIAQTRAKVQNQSINLLIWTTDLEISILVWSWDLRIVYWSDPRCFFPHINLPRSQDGMYFFWSIG
jgi:hypothetical protein